LVEIQGKRDTVGKLRALLCLLLPLACAFFGQVTDVSGPVTAPIPNATITIIRNATGAPLPDGRGSEYRTEPRPSGSGCRPEAIERVLIGNREAKLANREPRDGNPGYKGVIACERS